MSALPPDDQRCTERVPDGGRSVGVHRCPNRAKEDGLCGVHLRAKRQAAAKLAQWQADNEASEQRRAAAREAANQLLHTHGIHATPEYDVRGSNGYTGGIIILPASVAELLQLLGIPTDDQTDNDKEHHTS